MILPQTVRFGFTYAPRNIMRTYIQAEVENVNWKNVSPLFDDVFNYYIGLEHGITGRLPLRLGFNSQTTYQVVTDGAFMNANKILTPSLSAGTGFAISNRLTVDVATTFSFREYEDLDLFQDSYYNDKNYTGSSAYILWPNSHITLVDRGWENPDSVRESFVKVMASLTYKW
jgi:hypothetical protein